MDQSKRERLQARGWTINTVAIFLELTPEETMLVDNKIGSQPQSKGASAKDSVSDRAPKSRSMRDNRS